MSESKEVEDLKEVLMLTRNQAEELERALDLAHEDLRGANHRADVYKRERDEARCKHVGWCACGDGKEIKR